MEVGSQHCLHNSFAGRIYMEKCVKPKLDKAGECFSLAGCYKRAAEAYAKGNFLPECLAACIKGELFELGLEFILNWKQTSPGAAMIGNEQNFLEKGARHFFELEERLVMMKFVRAFHSMDKIRTFLWDSFCLDELLLIEKEKQNFVRAANIAKHIGNISIEVEMLNKALRFEDLSKAIMQFVFVHSLWQPGSKGWPLKPFEKKNELLNKAKINAEKASKQFYGFISTECDILSDERSTLLELIQYFRSSQNHENVRGEILSARKIIDAHLQLISALVESGNHQIDAHLTKHVKEGVSSHQFSVENLDCLWMYWNFWNNHIVNILQSLDHYRNSATKKYKKYEEFCLNYFGVLKHSSEGYLVLNPQAAWVKETKERVLRRKGKFVLISRHGFVSAAQTYWHSELSLVGKQILKNLETLYQISAKNSFPLIFRSIAFVDKTKREPFTCRHPIAETQQMLLNNLTNGLFCFIYPLDWRQSSTANMVSLRKKILDVNLLRQVVLQNISSKGNLTFGQMGRAIATMLGSGELTDELAKRFNMNSPWMDFIDCLCTVKRSRQLSKCSAALDEISLILELHEALKVTYNANWREEVDFVSPVCFMYIMERLLFLVSYGQGLIFATKSMVVEWLFFNQWKTTQSASSLIDVGGSEKSQILGDAYSFMASIVHKLLLDEEGTKEWLEKSHPNAKDYPLLVLRLVVIMCLICANSGKHFDLLSDILGGNHICSCLPKPFCDAFLGRQKCSFVQELAKALKQIESELVIVSWGSSHLHFSHAILLDDIGNKDKGGLLNELFPKRVSSHGTASEAKSSNSLIADQNLKVREEIEKNILQEYYEHFCGMFNALKPFENEIDVRMETITSNLPMTVVNTKFPLSV